MRTRIGMLAACAAIVSVAAGAASSGHAQGQPSWAAASAQGLASAAAHGHGNASSAGGSSAAASGPSSTQTAAATATATATATAAAPSRSSRTALPGSVPAWANAANLKGAAAAGDPVGFRVYLSLRNGAQAEALAAAVSNPASASYGQYLTPGQFQSRFAPAQADVNAVKSWLQSQGFDVNYVPSNNHYVSAEGTVAQVEAAFGATLNVYAVDGQALRAPSADLTVPAALGGAVAGVLGIDDSANLVRTLTKDPAAPPSGGFRNAPPCSSYWAEKTTANTQVGGTNLPDFSGSAQPFAPCGYAGATLQSVYGVKSSIDAGKDGSGVTVAVIDAYASPTIVSDANTYFGNHGLPTFHAGQFTQVVAPGTFRRPQNPSQDPQGWYGEETLDIEAVHTMAPGAKIVYVGAPNNYRDLDAALNHVVSQRLADIVTNSYGFSTEALPPGYIKPVNDTLVQAALEGIGVYFSSGDGGDETFGGPAASATPDWPASSPWVTAVGGTTLAAGTAGDPNAYVFETGWGTKRIRLNCTGLLSSGANAWCESQTYLYGSGGGTSRLFAQPFYQAGTVPNALATRWSSTPHRVVPDIAADGDPGTGMLVGQTQTFSTGVAYDEYRIGGTSLSSPLLAGIMAVAQQVRDSDIGFANPLIYALSASAFHDVQHMDGAVVRADYANSEDASGGVLYSLRTFDQTFTLHTTTGYDDVTGRGTPNGSFIAAVQSTAPLH